MLKTRLVYLADFLDKKGLRAEADEIDRMIRSAQLSPQEESIVDETLIMLKKIPSTIRDVWEKWKSIREVRPGVKSMTWLSLKNIFNSYLLTEPYNIDQAIKELSELT